MDILPTVKQAIAALAQPGETAKANEWLVDFEKSSSAWVAADLLLTEEKGSPYRFFGAKFLYSKIQRQFYELQRNQAEQLISSLVQHLLRLANEKPYETQVIRYLCLSVAALGVQLNQAGVVSQVLRWLNPIIPQAPSVLLILLTILPEEAYNRSIDTTPEIRDAFLNQLTQSNEEVIQFALSLWPNLSAAQDRGRILKCLENWIDIVDIPPEMIYKHNVLSLALESMVAAQQEEEVFEAAVDLVLILVKRYIRKDPTIVHNALPHILSLSSKWRAIHARVNETTAQGDHDEMDEDDRNEAFALCRLFTEVAETCIDMFSNVYTNFGQEVLLNLLLECAAFHQSHQIARIPLKFFYELSMMIKPPSSQGERTDANEALSASSDNSNNNGRNGDRLGLEMYQKYGPCYGKLLEVAVLNLTLPYPVLSGAKKMTDDQYERRSEWRESILDCSFVLTASHALDLLCQELESVIKSVASNGGAGGNGEGHASGGGQMSAQQANGWCRIEAILCCIQVVLPRLASANAPAATASHGQLASSNGNANNRIPQLISLLCTLPRELLCLQLTAIDLLGNLAPYLVQHSKYIMLFMDKLYQDLATAKTSLAASKAMMLILKATPSSFQQSGSAAASMAFPVLEWHEKVMILRDRGQLSLEAELNWLEGLAVAVAQHLPPTNSLSAINALLTNSFQGLQHALGQQQEKGVIQQLDRFSILVKYYHLPRDTHATSSQQYYSGDYAVAVRGYLVQLVTAFGYLDQVLRMHPNESISEKVCRCYRFAMKHYPYEMMEHLPQLMTLLSTQFAFYPVSPFLYAAATIISTYSLFPIAAAGQSSASSSETVAGGSALSPAIYEMVWSLSATFFASFPTFDHFIQKPDVVEEYYYLLAKLLQYIPLPFLQEQASTPGSADSGHPSSSSGSGGGGSNRVDTIVQAALSGLALDHREAQKGILSFLEQYLHLTSFFSSTPSSSSNPYYPMYNEMAAKMILQDAVGGRIVQRLFGLLCGRLFAYAIDESNGCIADVLWYLKRKYPQELQVSIVSSSLSNLKSRRPSDTVCFLFSVSISSALAHW